MAIKLIYGVKCRVIIKQEKESATLDLQCHKKLSLFDQVCRWEDINIFNTIRVKTERNTNEKCRFSVYERIWIIVVVYRKML